MALVLIATLGGRLLPALFAGFLGILVSMPGIAAATGQARLTFGFTELNDGFKLLPVLIGLFAVNQVFRDIVSSGEIREAVAVDRKGLWLGLADLKRQAVNMLRSSLVGTWIGILPGIGANIGSVAAYSLAKSVSKTPEKFGTGCDEGVVAAEAASMLQ
jgi:putative tricarboxylic transport membrane protein